MKGLEFPIIGTKVKGLNKKFDVIVANLPQEIVPEDYKKADGFLRKRSDLGLLTRRDEEIANFVERHNKRFF